MAINIQEILHPSDSNQIKWEKVNYNFDQILANGGGERGQKGSKGSQGSVGLTGATGATGAQGVKGEPGSTSSRWETITVDTDTNGIAEYVILKPKLESDIYHPVIFLGDQTFDNVNGNNGQVQLRSTLTIGHHADGGNSPSSEFLTLWHGERGDSNNNVAITISSSEKVDDNGNDFTRFKLDETYGVNLNTQPAEILEFYVGNDDLQSGLERWVFNTDVSFDGANASFQFPATNRSIATVKVGMVRFYNGQFEGAIADSNGNVIWTPFCMSPCGQGGGTGTIALDDNSDLNVGPDGSLLNTGISISGGDIDVDVDGDLWTGQSATTTAASAPSPTTTQAVTQTIDITSTSWTPSQAVSASSANFVFYYDIDGTPGGLLLDSSTVTTPPWVTAVSYSGGPNNNGVEIVVSQNTGAQRSGTIIIAHPNNGSVTDSVIITQASGSTTTAATTSASGSGSGDGSIATTTAATTTLATTTAATTTDSGSGTGDSGSGSGTTTAATTTDSGSGTGDSGSGSGTTTDSGSGSGDSDSGSGSGTCYQYTLYNGGGYFVGGSLQNVPDCNGGGNVSIGIQSNQSTTICTTATPPTISIALGNIGGSSVTITGNSAC